MAKSLFLTKKPTKIVCVGLNYKDHAREMKLPLPKEPVIFIKPATCLIGPGDMIRYPDMSQRVDFEAELALVIKKKARNISESQVRDHVLGFMCLNDVTARDLQFKDLQWTRAKSFDTFCPIGPKLVPWTDGFNPNHLEVKAILNGVVKQDGHTQNFIFSVEYVVSFISRVMTLNPGDIITTGTPRGIGPMQRGDTIEIKIEKIGSLINKVQ